MDIGIATLVAAVVGVAGQIIVTLFMLRTRARIEDIHTATNGMKAELEAVKFAAGVVQGEKNVTKLEQEKRDA